jgi:hypothetical protein
MFSLPSVQDEIGSYLSKEAMRPRDFMLPVVGAVTLDIFNSVDFPAPFLPIIPKLHHVQNCLGVPKHNHWFLSTAVIITYFE